MKNLLLEKLGFDQGDRVVIIHCDDVGMCQATLPAYEDLLDFGLITSASVMVSCPWFPGAAEFVNKNSGLDVGVHLTLNCEWDHYRWTPISTCDDDSGIIDEEGYMFRSAIEFQTRSGSEVISAEINKQIGRAEKSGIDITHIDTHMLSLLHIDYFNSYYEAGKKKNVPIMMIRENGLKEWKLKELIPFSDNMLKEGFPVLDYMVDLSFSDHKDRVGQAKHVIDSLKPGITNFMIHPAVETKELKNIASDWRIRVADYKAFLSRDLKNYIKGKGVHLIGYKEIRDLIDY